MPLADYDFTLTRNKIVEQALSKAGGLALGEVMSAEQLAQGADALNLLVKEWQNEHLFLWSAVRIPCAFLANSASLNVSSLEPPIVGIDAAVAVNGTSEDRLEVISYRDYLLISDKTTLGAPAKIAIQQISPSSTLLWVYPTPIANVTINLSAVTRLRDFDAAQSDGGFGSDWTLALVYGLAAVLADDYALSLPERQWLERQAGKYFLRAKRSNRDWADSDFVKGAY